jgi:hypothetical protein
MVFRKIYWVIEQMNDNGSSKVCGVFTSIPDLLDRGLCDCGKSGEKLRLSLHKLDCSQGALGTWIQGDSPQFLDDLKQFVETGEMNDSDCKELAAALG